MARKIEQFRFISEKRSPSSSPTEREDNPQIEEVQIAEDERKVKGSWNSLILDSIIFKRHFAATRTNHWHQGMVFTDQQKSIALADTLEDECQTNIKEDDMIENEVAPILNTEYILGIRLIKS